MDENESVTNGGLDDDVDLSSPDSSPKRLTGVPFHPPYRVVVREAVKNGDVLQFNIKVYKWDEDVEVSDIIREYGDIEWLHHNIITQNNIDGIIVPPLPLRPEVDAKSAEKQSKKQLGSDTKLVRPDEFSRDCRQIEKYLRLMLGHETFGNDGSLSQFLCEKEAPVRTKVNRGILHRMSNAVELARKGQHRDIDEFFSKKREWCTTYSRALKDASNDFNKMVNAQRRLSSSYAQLSTSLESASVNRDEASTTVNKYLSKLSDATEDTKHGLEILCNNDEKTLGFQLELYSRYIDSVKEMLFRRTCLLVDYEDANRALDKAKANKRQAAEDAKHAAETAYEMCCDNARREFKLFLQSRMLAYQDGLTSFAESQIRTARDTYTLLAKTMTALKQMNDIRPVGKSLLPMSKFFTCTNVFDRVESPMGVSNARDDCAERFHSARSSLALETLIYKRTPYWILFLAQYHRKIEAHLCSLPGFPSVEVVLDSLESLKGDKNKKVILWKDA